MTKKNSSMPHLRWRLPVVALEPRAYSFVTGILALHIFPGITRLAWYAEIASS